MTIHVDHQSRSTELHGQSNMPDRLLSQTQLQACDVLERWMRELRPLAAMTGSAGTGKTVVLNVLLARCESSGDRVIRVNNFVAGPLSLHRTLAASLGVPDASELSADALEPALREALAEGGRAAPPILGVDDAQSLLPETLRYLSLLAGLREGGRPLLRILLVGRPGLTTRQPIPLHFTMQPMAPDDAREVIRRTLTADGLSVPEGEVEELARLADGNWRSLAHLLRNQVDGAGTAGPRQDPQERAPRLPRRAASTPAPSTLAVRRASPRRSAVLPALLGVLALGGGAAALFALHEGGVHEGGMHDGGSVGHEAKPSPIMPPVAAPALAPAAPPGSEAAHGSKPASSPPGATGGTAIDQAGSKRPATPLPPLPQASVVASPPLPAAAMPVQLAPPLAASPPSAVPPVLSPPQATAPIAAALPPAPGTTSGTGTTSDTGVAIPSGTPPQQDSQQALVDRTSPGHFQLYNVGPCHRGICPRWSVLDLARHSHFFAGFNPGGLGLDPQAAQRLREGTLELTVQGKLIGDGPEGPVIQAGKIEAMSPHRRARSASPLSPPVTATLSGPLSPPLQLQSPPPGFLAFPPSHAPIQLAPAPMPPPVPLQ